MTELALLAHAYGYNNVRAAHIRYAGFLYGFLLVVGVEWFWRKVGRRQFWAADALAVMFAAYCLVAIRLMWLPPV